MKPIFLISGTLFAFLSASPAADPTWWTTRGVKNASPTSNLSPATVGQAKHMAAMALAELQIQLSPPEYSALHTDVAAMVSLAVPQTQAEFDNQRSVLLTGQLKALAKPFYDKLRTLDAAWVDNEMVFANIRVVEPGSNPISYSPYPWSVATSDDQNKAVATLGQLKAVFSLRFDTFRDADHDGLQDAWELQHFLNLDQTAGGDPDDDGLNNAQEHELGFDPLVSDATVDADADGLSNLQEVAIGTDAADPDTDGDQMGDGYEVWHTFSPLVVEIDNKGPAGDFDNDGTTNANEALTGRVATLFRESFPAPGPGNGMIAKWFGSTGFWYTIQYSTDMINWTTHPMGFMGTNMELTVDVGAWFGEPLPPSLFVRLHLGPAATADMDGDGMGAELEFQLGTDPTNADTDGDGISDTNEDADGDGLPNGWEIANGLNPLEATGNYGANGDPDGDGLINRDEFTSGGNAHNSDTDGDGMIDGPELLAGFIIIDPDENQNGELDGYEDFDDDLYVNFTEVLAKTNPYSASKKPDGESSDTLLITSFGTDFEKRLAVVTKIGNPGFVASPIVDDDGKVVGQGHKRFLDSLMVVDSERTLAFPFSGAGEFETEHSSSEEKLVAVVAHHATGGNLDLMTDSTSASTMERFYSYENLDSLTTFSVNTEDTTWSNHDGTQGLTEWYSAALDTGEGIQTWKYPSQGYPYWETTLYKIDEWNWPQTEILEEETKESSSVRSYRVVTSGENAYSYYKETTNYSNEYTDSKLKEHSTEILAARDYAPPYFLSEPCWSRFSYFDGRASTRIEDIEYNLKADVPPATRKVLFLWREVSAADPSPGAEPIQGTQPVESETWIHEAVDLQAEIPEGPPVPLVARTSRRELLHPDNGGVVYPAGTSRVQLSAPLVVAVDHDTPLPDGVSATIARNLRPVSFNVGPDLNKQDVSLVCEGSGKIKLWKRVKQGASSAYTMVPFPYSLKVEQKAGEVSLNGDFFVQGEVAGDLLLKLKFGALTLVTSAVKVVDLDLDVDSDNSGPIDQSLAEDILEADADAPGKFVIPNPDADEDDDKTPNHADLDHAGAFCEVKLRAANFAPTDELTFHYSASDPSGIQVPDAAAGRTCYVSPPGQFRLWKNDGNTLRVMNDFIAPEVPITVSNLFGQGDSATLYLQTMAGAGGQCPLRVTTNSAFDDVGLFGIDVVDYGDFVENFASGVDRTSVTAAVGDPGHQPKIWIMAPAGQVPAGIVGEGKDCSNKMSFEMPFARPMVLTMDCGHASPTEGNVLNLSGNRTRSWHGTVNTTTPQPEPNVVWSLGRPDKPTKPTVLPIGVKTMKNRKVKVKVYLVDLIWSDGSRRALDPDLIPTDQALQDHLYNVFTKQINTWFDVEIVKDKDPQTQEDVNFLADQRTDGDNSFTHAYTSISNDQQQVLSQTGAAGNVDIRVFMLATGSVFAPDGAGFGATSRVNATCWVAGDKTSLKYDTPEDVLSTIGHEIGHVLADYGHPDDASSPGKAPLLGTDRTVRLMCSGLNRDRQKGKLLVKAEWDEAEKWLSRRPNGDN